MHYFSRGWSPHFKCFADMYIQVVPVSSYVNDTHKVQSFKPTGK